VTRWDGDYVLIAKDNQATLADDLRLFFTDPPVDCRDWRTACTANLGHGRLEIRKLAAGTKLNAFLGRQWAGKAGVFQVTRTIYEHGQMRREVVYGISSLSPIRASAARPLALLRAHWRIENRVHWRRDVTLCEDHCQVRKGDAPRVLAILNSFLLALLDFLGVANVLEQMRIMTLTPCRLVASCLGHC
jgi:Transposase DDE domain